MARQTRATRAARGARGRRRDGYTTKQERQTAAVQKYAPRLRRINAQDISMLRRLARFRASHGREFARVSDLGGKMHSHHSNTLGKLAEHALVDVSAEAGDRAPLIYRINRKGTAALRAVLAVD